MLTVGARFARGGVRLRLTGVLTAFAVYARFARGLSSLRSRGCSLRSRGELTLFVG